jgi:hypothetical protein
MALWMPALMCLATSTSLAAQGVTPSPPGPFVIDVRAVSLGLPQDAGFYPPLPEATPVPARGFGADVGAHIYFTQVGPGRLGAGASVFQVRGTAGQPVSITARVLAPQLSINFGTSQGWSYVSGGIGAGSIRGRFEGSAPGSEDERESDTLMTFHVGGGARWFFSRHLAIGFDIRLHRLGQATADDGAPITPAVFLGSVSVGFSIK